MRARTSRGNLLARHFFNFSEIMLNDDDLSETTCLPSGHPALLLTAATWHHQANDVDYFCRSEICPSS
jgi:hypothetical protein